MTRHSQSRPENVPPGRLRNKRAIVLGAGQTPGERIGNGRAIAVRFAQEGARVLCVDRELERAQETVDIIAAEGGSANAFAADISVSADVTATVQKAMQLFGRIDILANNVGIGGPPDAPAHQLEESGWDHIIGVNLKGAWMVAKAVIPIMREQMGGAIVHVSSVAAYSGSGQTAYEISKAGINRLTLNLANRNGHFGIRCNAILPGLMDTSMVIPSALATGEKAQEIRTARDQRVILRKKQGTGFDTANAALFLVSDEAQFITGALLPVDGGALTAVGV